MEFSLKIPSKNIYSARIMATSWTDPSIVTAVVIGILSIFVTVLIYWLSHRSRSRPVRVEQALPHGTTPVSVGIVQRGNEVIMVRRKAAEKNLLWHFPAGVVKAKRSPEETIIKEVNKETGVVCAVEREVGRRRHPDNGADLIYYHCRYVSGELKNGDPEENAEVRWMSAGSACELITSDIFPAVQKLLINVASSQK
jgi:ADP-ribose pyrophosphatase YjhB (NUDIX family)